MSSAQLPLSDSVISDADDHGSSNSVYLDRRMRDACDRDMPCRAEKRFDLDRRATHLDSVQDFGRPRDGDGREYAQNADRDRELDNGERVSHYPSAGFAG
jgi:hypothetical protein